MYTGARSAVTASAALHVPRRLRTAARLPSQAPLLANYKHDYQFWYYGLIPTAAFLILTIILGPVLNILTWDDPLASFISGEEPPSASNARGYAQLGAPPARRNTVCKVFARMLGGGGDRQALITP
jgi:hypothetical protein